VNHKRGHAHLATRYGDIRVHPAYRCAHAGYTASSFAVAVMLSPTPGCIRIDSGELLLTRDPPRA
jgi:hypothetical protein